MRKLTIVAVLCAAPLLIGLTTDAQGQESSSQAPPPAAPPAASQAKPATPPAPKLKGAAASQPVDPNAGKTIEEIIARVNNEIITLSEYEKAKQTSEEDAKQECQGRCTPAQLQTAIEDGQKNTLRNLIDQSLLVQRGKDMGISVKPEVIKQLDQIRQQNKLASIDDLEKAVTSEGMNWEDFQSGIENRLLTQKVIGQEVGSHINITDDEVQKYYDAHKTEFVRPEQVALREIQVNTQGKGADELPALKKKAETALKRVQDGEDFGEIAKRYSDSSTKDQGGFLGQYKRGELAKELEDKVFAMKRNQLTDVLETKQGYLILQVLEHYDEGQQSLDKVRNEITNKLYEARMEPALHGYLKTLREQSYVIIKPGYQDIAGEGGSEIQEVSATPEVNKQKKGHKKFLLFGKRAGGGSGKSADSGK
ncbi:MAG TPA: peptidyl-prolyl cis-trans isomerase [Candidatus Acidoferrum sp.]|nr:peptidyl-prolyl cis-trans isomerase [Candidatus Acidoferrum sp.]